MVRVKVKVIGKGTREDPLRVNLPTYFLVEDVDLKDRTVTVEVPDDECKDGKLDKEKIRLKYKGQPLWDRQDVTEDL